MRSPVVAFFSMAEFGHLIGLLPLVSGLTRLGARCLVFTDRRYRDRVEAAGGSFVDLFAGRPVSAADDSSMPVPCRYVSFAGHFGADVIREIRQLEPALVVYDTFAVIGPVVGRALGIPSVNVCAGHDVNPADFLRYLTEDPRRNLSDRCHRAVEILREDLGFPEASPFLYVTALSPFLNLYGEPPAFLDPDRRSAFAPIAFFGSLPDLGAPEPRCLPSAARAPREGSPTKIYVSFGTVVWRYYRSTVLAALRSIADCVGRDRSLRAVISLAGGEVAPDEQRALEKENVSVQSFVDQWSVLRGADLFLTHQGLRSTHEAAYHRIPMISYPFFWDQPKLARKCHELGLGLPLTAGLREPPSEDHVRAAISECLRRRATLAESLQQAREGELDTLAGRPEILEGILALARDPGAAR